MSVGLIRAAKWYAADDLYKGESITHIAGAWCLAAHFCCLFAFLRGCTSMLLRPYDSHLPNTALFPYLCQADGRSQKQTL